MPRKHLEIGSLIIYPPDEDGDFLLILEKEDGCAMIKYINQKDAEKIAKFFSMHHDTP